MLYIFCCIWMIRNNEKLAVTYKVTSSILVPKAMIIIKSDHHLCWTWETFLKRENSAKIGIKWSFYLFCYFLIFQKDCWFEKSLQIILELENQPFKFHHSNAKIEVRHYAKIQIARHLRENFSVRKHARIVLKILLQTLNWKITSKVPSSQAETFRLEVSVINSHIVIFNSPGTIVTSGDIR